jgi:hypothetical protein
VDEVVLLDEDLAQPALAAGVVFEVELVKAVERVFVGVHVERVDVEVVARHRQRVKHLFFCGWFGFFVCVVCLPVCWEQHSKNKRPAPQKNNHMPAKQQQ